MEEASSVSGYYIYRAAKADGKFRRIASVKKAYYKVTASKAYFYKAAAYKKLGGRIYRGALSAAVAVTGK